MSQALSKHELWRRFSEAKNLRQITGYKSLILAVQRLVRVKSIAKKCRKDKLLKAIGSMSCLFGVKQLAKNDLGTTYEGLF